MTIAAKGYILWILNVVLVVVLIKFAIKLNRSVSNANSFVVARLLIVYLYFRTIQKDRLILLQYMHTNLPGKKVLN